MTLNETLSEGYVKWLSRGNFKGDLDTKGLVLPEDVTILSYVVFQCYVEIGNDHKSGIGDKKDILIVFPAFVSNKITAIKNNL